MVLNVATNGSSKLCSEGCVQVGLPSMDPGGYLLVALQPLNLVILFSKTMTFLAFKLWLCWSYYHFANDSELYSIVIDFISLFPAVSMSKILLKSQQQQLLFKFVRRVAWFFCTYIQPTHNSTKFVILTYILFIKSRVLYEYLHPK